MEEFVAYLVKNLVATPSEVNVTSKEEEGVMRLEIRVAEGDIGKVIGRKGNTINALRIIVRTVAARLGRHVQVELVQREQAACEAPVALEATAEEEAAVL